MSNPKKFEPPRRDFLGKPAPPGYVAGIGRGDSGFTTRSDIGPPREFGSSSDGPPHAKRLARLQNDDNDDLDLNDTNYDPFAGYGGSLFDKAPYDEDDEEADRIYDAIDKHQDERGKSLRESKARQQLELYRKKNPKIQQQFSDLKADLRQISELEWMNLPEVGDARNRKQRAPRPEKYTPIPDSILAQQAKNASGGDLLAYIDPMDIDKEHSDDEAEPDRLAAQEVKPDARGQPSTSSRAADVRHDPSLDIGTMNEFRGSRINMKLNTVSRELPQALSTQDYLSSLQTMKPSQVASATSLREHRRQMEELRKSNPTFANGWIASSRLEEGAGRLKVARQLIMAGVEKCPKSVELWCEAVRLHPRDEGRGLVLKALRENPRSERLWCLAAELEPSEAGKRRVFAKAREVMPKSAALWEKSIELEPEPRAVLQAAVQCCPEVVSLWLELARREPFEEAVKVLVRASERHPKERSVWLAAAKLQESRGNKELALSVVRRAVDLATDEFARPQSEAPGVERDEEAEAAELRRVWFEEARRAERESFRWTCAEIVARVGGWRVAEARRLDEWLALAGRFADEGSPECARACFEQLLGERGDQTRNEAVWRRLVEFERAQSQEAAVEALRRALRRDNCPKSESLWLQLVAALRDSQQVQAAREALGQALRLLPASEPLVLAGVDLECAAGGHKAARKMLADAQMAAPERCAQIMLRHARLERELGNADEAERVLLAGAAKFRDAADFYLQLGELAEETRADVEAARGHYAAGLRFAPTCVELWLRAARLEERQQQTARARSKLQMARVRNPKSVALWLESARLEVRALGRKLGPAAKTPRPDAAIGLLAKGARECRGQPLAEQLDAELRLLSEPNRQPAIKKQQV